MKNQETLTLFIKRLEEKGTAAAFMLFPVFFLAAGLIPYSIKLFKQISQQ